MGDGTRAAWLSRHAAFVVGIAGGLVSVPFAIWSGDLGVFARILVLAGIVAYGDAAMVAMVAVFAGILALTGIVGGLVGRGLGGLLGVMFGVWAVLLGYAWWVEIRGPQVAPVGVHVVFEFQIVFVTIVVLLTTGLAYLAVRGVARLLASRQ